MPGFSNISGDESIMYADNASFNGTERGGKMTANGQLWIGATASPHVRVGTLASSGGSVTITNSAGGINLEAGAAVPTTFTANTGSATPAANNINLIGSGSITTTGAASTETISLTGLTNHAILVGAGTDTITKVGPSATAGQIFQSAGAAADPVFSTATYPSTAGTSGKVLQSDGTNFIASSATFPSSVGATGTILRSDGTNWVATTSTYPNTNAISTLVYASAANVLSALSTANNGLLVTSSTGVPSILAGPGATGKVLQSNAAAAPSFSTATYPSVATSSGTILRADGTNWVASTPTYPNAASTAGKVVISDGTNLVMSTPTFPNASATSGKFIRSDGTNWIASTPTLPTTGGTASTILRSDGTNWVNTSGFKVSSADVMTNTGQPLLYASLNGDQANATGDGTNATVVWNTVNKQQGGSNLNTGTGQYTFPITGVYYLHAQILVDQGSTSFTSMELSFVIGGSAVKSIVKMNPANSWVSSQQTFQISQLYSATASEVLTVAIKIGGSTKTLDLLGDFFEERCCLSIFLVA